MRKAAVDIGTNTFHLLIADITDDRITQKIFSQRIFVYLAEDGINHFSSGVLKRVFEALHIFKRACLNHDVEDVIFVGTSAMRNANNSHTISEKVMEVFKKEVYVVSGSIEAQIIAKGVELATSQLEGSKLIMDIGGGSVEIIMESDGIYHFQSLPIGISRLYKKFHESDPISPTALYEMNQFIREKVLEGQMITGAQNFIGVAGSFEILSSRASTTLEEFNKAMPMRLLEEMCMLDFHAREIHHAIPTERAFYIIEALSLMTEILAIFDFEQHWVCPFSLKEGALFYNF